MDKQPILEAPALSFIKEILTSSAFRSSDWRTESSTIDIDMKESPRYSSTRSIPRCVEVGLDGINEGIQNSWPYPWSDECDLSNWRIYLYEPEGHEEGDDRLWVIGGRDLQVLWTETEHAHIQHLLEEIEKAPTHTAAGDLLLQFFICDWRSERGYDWWLMHLTITDQEARRTKDAEVLSGVNQSWYVPRY